MFSIKVLRRYQCLACLACEDTSMFSMFNMCRYLNVQHLSIKVLCRYRCLVCLTCVDTSMFSMFNMCRYLQFNNYQQFSLELLSNFSVRYNQFKFTVQYSKLSSIIIFQNNNFCSSSLNWYTKWFHSQKQRTFHVTFELRCLKQIRN